MHDALQVAEILENICSFAEKRTLACLIRTCWTFEELSRNALWKELDSLVPLFRLFPDGWDADGTTTSHCLMRVEDWERIQRYTSRVTSILLELDSLVSFYPQSSLMQHISSPEALLPMFPKLKEVRSSLPLWSWIIPIFHWVNGPAVISVRLDVPCYTSDYTALGFITSLSTLYPNATTVVLELEDPGSTLNILQSRHNPDMPLYQSLSQAIRGWTHLTVVSFYGTDTAAYEHLSRLKSLTALFLTLQPNFIQCLREADLPSTPFPSLSELTLVAAGVAQLSEWMNCLHLSPTCLGCIMSQELTRSEIVRLACSIASTFCHRSLEAISLEAPKSNGPRHVSWMRPLFTFNRLRFVNFASFCPTFIDDDGLKELGSAWPLLEELHFNKSVPLDEAEEGAACIIPTFHGFFSLIKSCPRLRDLSIVMDIRDTAWIDVDACKRNNNVIALNTLALGNSLVDDFSRVVMIFGLTSPLLTSFSLGEKTWQVMRFAVDHSSA